MSLETPTPEASTPEWSPVRWAFNVWTWLCLLAAILIFEIWADPVLAAIALCFKLAEQDFVTGFRLRYDPQPTRGIMMSYYALGQACLKLTLIGIVALVGSIVIELVFEWGTDRWLGGLCAVISGLFAAMFFLIGAAAKSRPSNVRPWLDKTIYRHLRNRQWPPRCDGSRNRVPVLLLAGMFATSAVLLPIVGGFFFQAQQAGNEAPGAWAAVATLLPLWGWMMWTFGRAIRYTARSPSECWWEESTQPKSTIPAPAESGRSLP